MTGLVISVVVPTVGRPSLAATLAALPAELEVVVVDDRPPGPDRGELGGLPRHARVVRSGGRGPAAARNAGWRASEGEWVAFLDDDVVPGPGWARALLADLADLPADVAACQGRIEVPLPAGRRPTDAERDTAGLAEAGWITADIAYRRSALERTGGFDERFPRAYREDADLALRVSGAGLRLVRGRRVSLHPVRDDGFLSSLRRQRGNADDALMRRVHGPGWRERLGGAPGRLRRHALTSALGVAAAGLAARAWAGGAPPPVATARRGTARSGTARSGTRAAVAARAARGRTASGRAAGRAAAGWTASGWAAAVAGLGWAALTAEFAWARIAPGPRSAGEVARMLVTSVAIPPAACLHRVRGELRARR
ncbi:glycosyltransferase family 2 protein [Streptosporangium longisporum]|uniref:glycosyltransferase family 2 protein n=1 Tax=Streptosporangium longisporum TaxID=46187 RepID=UPI0031E9DB9C